jgi:hypothetical protein
MRFATSMRWLPASGPAVARLFHRLLALVFLDAWISLLRQVKTLYGSSGLLSIDEYLSLARQEHVPFHEIPTLFWLGASDRALVGVCCLGIVLALVALVRAPRVCHGVNTLLYLSFVTGGHTFLNFQWDNLLLECGLFAVFLPRDRRAAWVHTIFRLILFKLYFESGLAKSGSPLGDWWNGSAMAHYYETAPLPTWLAWHAHHLPAWWHAVESWTTLLFELVFPFFIFGPRPLRLFAAGFFTFFQLFNASTANYGFFCYLAIALHVFCLDDVDVERAWAWVRARFPRLGRSAVEPVVPVELSPRGKKIELATSVAVLLVFGSISLVDGLVAFGHFPRFDSAVEPLREAWYPFRLVNTYHLFAAITVDRIEPEFQTRDHGVWSAHDLRYKMGDVTRRPGLVAPHMPRVDWQLWFYGLEFQHGTPDWVVNLLDRLCNDPAAVQSLFVAPLDPHPEAVRIVFWDYRFTTADEKRATGAWWRRSKVAETRPIDCDTR